MKKFVNLFVVMFIVGYSGLAQTLIVANNNPGAATGVNVYTGVNALRDAFTASVAGDIIYVVPSPTTYGYINITHGITIFGVGIRPSKDLGAKSLIGLIDVNSSDVRLSGLVHNNLSTNEEIRLGWALSTNIDGIIIENCLVKRILMEATPDATVSNLMIRNNVITGTGSLATHILLNTTANAIVTNNILIEGGSGPMVRALNATFTYNVFTHTGNEQSFDSVDDCIFDHNIFYGIRVDIPATSTGNSWTNNLSFGNTTNSFNVFNVTDNGNNDLAAPGSNVESVSGTNDPLFVNFPLTSDWNDSYDLALQGGSPALNVNGEDIGPSGGTTPFDFEGNLLPLIQSVTIPSVIPVGTDLPVTIKAKGN